MEDIVAEVLRLLPEQVGYEASLLAGLGAARQRELAGILGELLVVLEGRLGGLGADLPAGGVRGYVRVTA
ncbi:hypothetical protein [Actinomadura sp. 21ATH]|uniref:hypothetical protein n=1 Tax=Actinomadura sp. 21ATH TaxID=1735444 RepID=UPI0035BFDE21